MTTPLLEIEKLHTFFYTDNGVARAVDGVSFSVGVGETVGVVGESGCGKSVTALSILRLVRPPGRIEEGSVMRFEGRDLLELDEREMQHVRGNRIAMVFQEPMTALNPVFTIGDQIGEVARIHAGMSKRDAWAKAIEMLKVVGIPAPEQRAGEYPHQLSGGMRQRVVIAMALVMNPALVIADEPTTALDVTIQAQILELLADLTRRLGTSVLLITHDLGVVAENCTRVIVMYAARSSRRRRRSISSRARTIPTRKVCSARCRASAARRIGLATIPGHGAAADELAEGLPLPRPLPVLVGALRAEHPPLYQIGGGHTSRCHLADEPERRQHPHPPLAASGRDRGMTAPAPARDARSRCSSVRDLTKHFPIKRGVFGASRVRCAPWTACRSTSRPARRSRSSGSRDAASPPPAARSFASSSPRRDRSTFDGVDVRALDSGGLRKLRRGCRSSFRIRSPR
jgi:ABC-type dipeptide/oligopeptide/nickel transport system ATPase component